MTTVYADNAATTQMSRAAIDAMLPSLETVYGNPSSLHSIGQQAAGALLSARERIAKCLNTSPREIYFTSGGSEADDQAILSAARLGERKGKKHIISTAFEHHAVLHTLKKLEKEGFEVELLPVGRIGTVTAQQVKDAIAISQEIGGRLAEAHPGVAVDVQHPAYTVDQEVRDLSAYVHGPALPGAGGLPTGVGGRAMCLLSGGIDSPVSAYMMAKRGVEIESVHFFSYPYTSQLAKDKVLELARLVTRYSGKMTVNIVSFTEIQEAIRDNCPEEYFTLIMRRFMMEISQRLAREDGCGALVTGENLGQVASQTMEAMTVTGAVVDMPIFMPLVGMDKEEIITIARKIGTLETSILPYEDCCTVFTPKHPKTKPTLGQVVHAERNLDREALITRALESVEKIKVAYHDEPLL